MHEFSDAVPVSRSLSNPKPETSSRPRRSDQTPVPIEPCFSHSQRVQGFGV